MPFLTIKVENIQNKPELYLSLWTEGKEYLHLSTFLSGTSADDFFSAVRKAETEYYSRDPRNPNCFPGNFSQLDLELP